MIKKINLTAIVSAAILSLATPSRTSNSSSEDLRVPQIRKFTILAPLEQRLKGMGGMEIGSVRRIMRYDPFIRAAAREHGIDPRQIYSMIYVESRGNSKATSRKGARGLMQIMPITQKHLGMTRREALDPKSNIKGGTRYYSDLLDCYEGNEVLALAAYNMGPRKVDELIRIYGWDKKKVTYEDLKYKVYRETRNYIADVLAKREIIERAYL